MPQNKIDKNLVKTVFYTVVNTKISKVLSDFLSESGLQWCFMLLKGVLVIKN